MTMLAAKVTITSRPTLAALSVSRIASAGILWPPADGGKESGPEACALGQRKSGSFVFVDRDAPALASFFPVQISLARKPWSGSYLLLAAIVLSACGTPTVADTVDLGDNPEPPSITID